MKILFLIIIFNYNLICNNIILEEKNEFILDGVSKILISKDNNSFYIINLSNNLIVKYDLKTGNILNYYKSHIGLCDSVAKNIHKPYRHKNKEWEFITLDYFENKYNFNVRLKSPIINYLDDFQEKDSSLIVFGLFYGYKQEINGKKTSVEPRNTICKFSNTLVLNEVINLEIKNNLFTKTGITFKDDLYYVQIYNSDLDIKDQYYTLSLFDKNGYHKENILTLPNLFIDKKIYYNLPFKPLLTFKGDSLLYAYQYIDTVYLGNGKSFHLKNLEVSNELKFKTINELIEKDFKNFDILHHFNFKIEQIKYYDNKLYIIIRTSNEKKELNFEILVYDYVNHNLFFRKKFSGKNIEAFAFNNEFSQLYQIYFDENLEKYYLTKIGLN